MISAAYSPLGPNKVGKNTSNADDTSPLNMSEDTGKKLHKYPPQTRFTPQLPQAKDFLNNGGLFSAPLKLE